MQYTFANLYRWLARSAAAAALLLSTGACAESQPPAETASFDDLQLTAYQQYAIMCNTCTTADREWLQPLQEQAFSIVSEDERRTALALAANIRKGAD